MSEKIRDPEEKFKELAEKRVVGIIKSIRNLGKLSEKRNYTYSDDQIRKIFKALRDELNKTESLFSNDKSSFINFKL